MEQNHQHGVLVGEARRDGDQTFDARPGPEQPRAIAAAEIEAHRVADEAAEPEHADELADAERAGMRGIAGEQAEQQAVRSGIGEQQRINRLAVLADDVEKGCQVGREQHERSFK